MSPGMSPLASTCPGAWRSRPSESAQPWATTGHLSADVVASTTRHSQVLRQPTGDQPPPHGIHALRRPRTAAYSMQLTDTTATSTCARRVTSHRPTVAWLLDFARGGLRRSRSRSRSRPRLRGSEAYRSPWTAHPRTATVRGAGAPLACAGPVRIRNRARLLRSQTLRARTVRGLTQLSLQARCATQDVRSCHAACAPQSQARTHRVSEQCSHALSTWPATGCPSAATRRSPGPTVPQAELRVCCPSVYVAHGLYHGTCTGYRLVRTIKCNAAD
jgi:hypothetical protein